MPDTAPSNSPAPAQAMQPLDILVHIDLLGMPDESVFNALRDGMAARKWLSTLTTDDGQVLPLPFGTFSGKTSEPVFNLSQEIYDWITRSVWPQGAIVLANELAAWSISGS